MTESEVERLPEILRDIVLFDRGLAVLRRKIARPVVSIEDLRSARERLQLRRELSAAAEQSYGYRLGGDGTART
ncbi:hypothetical protein [Methylobacterium sp. A54F]